MSFVNGFTDNPADSIKELPENALLYSITVNPAVKDRVEYVITYWID